MIIKDTSKAAELFAKFDVPLSGYIINRVLPAELKEQNIPEYFKNRLAMQEHYLKVIDTTFGNQILASGPGDGTGCNRSAHDRKDGQGHVWRNHMMTGRQSSDGNRITISMTNT